MKRKKKKKKQYKYKEKNIPNYSVPQRTSYTLSKLHKNIFTSIIFDKVVAFYADNADA